MAFSLKGKLDVSTYTTNLVFGNFYFLLFLGFLGVVYIANAHLAEKRIRDIQRLEKEIKELKWEYMSIKRGVLLQSLQSDLDSTLSESALYLPQSGPKVILKKR